MKTFAAACLLAAAGCQSNAGMCPGWTADGWVANGFNHCVAEGAAQIAVLVVSLLLQVLLVRFLYQRKIFLRL